ncbi:glutamate synthase domain-containing protein [Burkholderia pseudomallei]|nr:glutamate synthase domain-containing protein [Burkholderia pseudomallei]
MLSRRYLAMWCALALFAAAAVLAARHTISWLWIVPVAALVALGLYDLNQDRHAILRNYPLWGHLRFLFEFIRPEIRQYFVEDDTDEKPFSRAQRSVVYQRAKNVADNRPYGTELDVKAVAHEWISHSLAPTKLDGHDFRIRVGATRKQPYDISIFNISAMSFGALSANAIRALNLGAKQGGFAHDTGEGSLSKYHREHGGDIIWEIGSGYFGCRRDDGTFDPEKFAKQAREPQVKMIEVKLSQGAKPGHGGVLPAAKITPEIAETRGVPMGKDCVSPAAHSAFSTPRGLLEFVDRLRELSGGKPTGFKLCVGHPWEFFGIAKAMLETGIVPDFIVVDGAEGGTGAAPLEFTDHVGVPLQEGLLLVHNTLVGIGLREQVKLGASGKIITAFDIARTLAIGADWVNSARGFMFAVGCIQAQHCHTDRCPTGVATQDPVRQRALVVPDKADRVYNFHRNTLHALQELVQAAGLSHPSELRAHHIVQRVAPHEVRLMSQLLKYLEPGALLNGGHCGFSLYETWWPLARGDSFSPGEGAYARVGTGAPARCHRRRRGRARRTIEAERGPISRAPRHAPQRAHMPSGPAGRERATRPNEKRPGRGVFFTVAARGGALLGHRVDERLALRQLREMLVEIRMAFAPVDLGHPEIEVAERAPERDVGERVVVADAPRLAGEALRHRDEAVVDLALLARDPRVAAMLRLALRVLDANRDRRVEHAVAERLPAPHLDALAPRRRNQLADGRKRVDVFADHARVEHGRAVLHHEARHLADRIRRMDVRVRRPDVFELQLVVDLLFSEHDPRLADERAAERTD